MYTCKSADSTNEARSLFADYTRRVIIKLDAGDLAEDFINDYSDDDNCNNVVSKRIYTDLSSSRHVYEYV
jgi:hypothetical protein